ncbi:MAG: HipA domain-containing protein [Geodermatophilaceae bacterium]|nr:HipA domain-containing protein [Geodermatophilaceae bacterium]
MTSDPRDVLEDLKFVQTADVYKSGLHAGRLRRHEGGVEFSYLPDYRESGGPSVATTLPVDGLLWWRGNGAVPAFFAGLLPEGRRLTALRRSVKTSADDELTLLLAVGEDAVGDVQVVPEGATPGEVAPRIAVTSFDQVEFADLFVQETGQSVDRVGIPGVQDKVSAAMITLPVRDRSSSYILKLDPPEFRHLVANEDFFLRAARACGLAVVEASVVHDRSSSSGLLVRRFDRERGQLRERRAFEDGCQVLDLPPASKYALSSEIVLTALTRVARSPLVLGRAFLQQIVFGYLTCNGDLHARNLGILFSESGEWTAAPAFDLPSSYPYGDTSVAMSVYGKRREDIGRADVLALAAGIGIPGRATERVIDDILDRSDSWIDTLDELPFDQAVLRRLVRAIGYRRRRLGARGT